MSKKLKTTKPKKFERYPASVSLLYGVKSHKRLAKVLGWKGTTGQLRSFSVRKENFNRYIDRSKPGKERVIEAPAKRVKEFQSKLLDLLRRVILPEYLHSARPNRGYLSNSLAHCDADGCTLTMDLDSFYQSVTDAHVSKFFEQTFKCAPDVATTMANLLCCDGHLATGSPASPLVSFWAHRALFDRVAERVARRQGVFTLYVDDIAITGRGFGHTDVKWIGRLLRPVGLSLKETKTRVFRAQKAKVVTGRAFRNGVSRAPNKQHLKMRDAAIALHQNPTDATLKASLAGRKRHLALLDQSLREVLRAGARELLK
jgi:RNA-directed DNA polymerase